jgi:hypothetical protein
VLDPWEVTSQRPDASVDGLHFGECKRAVQLAEVLRRSKDDSEDDDSASKDDDGASDESLRPPLMQDQDKQCVNRVVNQMFFNMLCGID